MAQLIKRVAHYAPFIWAKGGIASYVERLGTAQEEIGLDVHYLTKKVSEDSPKENTTVVQDEKHLFDLVKERQVDILHLHKPVKNLPGDRVTTVRTMHGNQGSCPTGTRFLARSEKPCDKKYSVAGCAITHLTERCGSLRLAKLKRNFNGILTEHELGNKLHTFTVSRFLMTRMLDSGYAEEKLHVLHSPAPDAFLTPVPPPTSGTPRFLFLGRLVPQKGPQWILKALMKVDVPVKLDIGGEGPLRAQLEYECKKHGLQHRVQFHGWLSQERVKALLANSRAVIVPSLWHEPAGLVTLEAAAAGRPVIASRVGGVPEYALDEYSILVNPGDTLQMAAAISRLAKDPERAARMGECALRNARNRYNMRQFVERQRALYHVALEEKNYQLA